MRAITQATTGPVTFMMTPGGPEVDIRCDLAMIAVGAIDDAEAHTEVAAERAFLAQLGGGCNLPCAAYARIVDGQIEIEVLMASLDGRVALRARASGVDPEAVGVHAAHVLLDERGGRMLLEEVA